MFPIAHAVLRDRHAWLGTRQALVPNRDGALELARVAAPADGRAITLTTNYPYAREASGLAISECGDVFVADTAHDRVLFVNTQCSSEAWLSAPGGFRQPRGLVLGAVGATDALLVADTGHARVQSLALPQLEPNIALHVVSAPTSIARDSKDRLLVVDSATKQLLRCNRDGTLDAAFNAQVAAQAKLQSPLFVASGPDDCVLVSDAVADAVFVFDADGSYRTTLPAPTTWQPGALAISDERAYVADASSGVIWVYSIGAAFEFVGQVAGWRGPVTALATNSAGDLFIKPGLDTRFYRFAANAAYVSSGVLTAGPFDAGEDREWARAWIDATTPDDTQVAVEVVLKDTDAAPLPSDWLPLISMDTWLSQQTHDNRRYLWVRVSVGTASPRRSPLIQQIRAATGGEDLLAHLPMTYAHNDVATNGFLSRWLHLLRGEFGRIEEALDDMPRQADARHVATSALPWLARWLGLELPQIASADDKRALLERAVALFARRGTPRSIAEFVELHTGIRPTIIEAFEDRRIWMLGESSRLDFDTRLPALDPHGMIVADTTVESCRLPLAGERSGCSPCDSDTATTTTHALTTPIGRAVVGESGPLASHQIGLPLFAEEAHRFCVIVDRYRVAAPGVLQEIARIVDREKPAHTDYRIAVIDPEIRIGLQARVGIDAIVGGGPAPLQLDAAHLDLDAHTPPSDVARLGSATLGMLALT